MIVCGVGLIYHSIPPVLPSLSGTQLMSLKFARPAILPLIVVAVVLAAGCVAESRPAAAPTSTLIPPPTATPVPTPTPTPAPLIFLPGDEAPHNAPVEWWYFNGMLRDGADGEYSYHFVTFQSPGAPGVTPHLLQASLGDHGRGVHYAAERGMLAPERPDARGVDVATSGWVMRGDGGGYQLRFSVGDGDGGTTLELRAVPRRPPTLHGGSGLVDMGPGAGSTYYYSRTRLDVTGWIEDAAGRRPVRGPGWMDHQWGEIAGGRVGWDWASIQLDDGADLMAAVVWQPGESGGRRRLAGHGTYVAPGGGVTYVESSNLTITAQGQWDSPETGVAYPMGWRLETGPLELELELTPYIRQAEFDSGILGVAYWEGAVSVAGERGGQPVSGWGFVELAGYDPRQVRITPPAATP